MLSIAPAESPQSPGPEVPDLVLRAIFMSAPLRGFSLQLFILVSSPSHHAVFALRQKASSRPPHFQSYAQGSRIATIPAYDRLSYGAISSPGCASQA
jgi:hypothetical protein